MEPADRPPPPSTLTLRRQMPNDRDEVRAFNERLLASGKVIPFLLSESTEEQSTNGKQPWLLLAGGVVRGGVLLTPQRALVGAVERLVVNIQAPITEAIIDPQCASVSVGLFREIQRQFGYAYAVGMGGLDRPLPRLLRALKWQVDLAPFRFVPFRLGRVATRIQAIRDRIPPLLRPTAAVVGAVASPLYRSALRLRRRSDLVAIDSHADAAAAVADAWSLMAGSTTFGLMRDKDQALSLFSMSQKETVLQRRGDRQCVAVVRTRRFQAPSPFAGLSVATVLELLAPSDQTLGDLSRRVLAHLAANDVDLAITNVSREHHVQVLDRTGWLKAPSNFVVALSPKISSAGVRLADAYVTRTDGDGRLNL